MNFFEEPEIACYDVKCKLNLHFEEEKNSQRGKGGRVTIVIKSHSLKTGVKYKSDKNVGYFFVG